VLVVAVAVSVFGVVLVVAVAVSVFGVVLVVAVAVSVFGVVVAVVVEAANVVNTLEALNDCPALVPETENV
jgi:hypothetical protein